MTLMIVKKCFALILLTNAFSFSMKMNLKMIVMTCVKTNDVFDNEEVDMNDDLACDEGDMLDTYKTLIFPPLMLARISDFSLTGM